MADWVPISEAWTQALYGPAGFYRREQPSDHFRTSSHAGLVFAEAVSAFAARRSLTRVVDIGAGAGELLTGLLTIDSDLDLLGVDLRPRPTALPPGIRWFQGSGLGLATGSSQSTLVIANEVLDNIACDVVEVDDDGSLRLVEVDVASGDERLGEPAPLSVQAWVHQWWDVSRPGERAEVGLARDEWWTELVDHWSGAVCVAIDYGHLAPGRPTGPTLESYRRGRSHEPRFDGDHDLTAHVAVDSLAYRAGSVVTTQRDVLHELGFTGTRPPIEQATKDPAGYVRALSRASEIAELTESPGLGDFWWVVSWEPVGA